MNHQLLQKFIEDNKNKPLHEVAMKISELDEESREFVLNQINGIQKTSSKLTEWHTNKSIIYPDKQAVEQSSSQAAAEYKASLLKGSCVADISGGMGVDAYYFYKSFNFKKVIYSEPNIKRLTTAIFNFANLKAAYIHTYQATAEEFLELNQEEVDLIYVDPDRRVKTKGRSIKIEDCEPNMLLIQEKIYSRSPRMMIKYSPMLDISQSVLALKGIYEVHVLSIDNECKELLFIGESEYKGRAKIKCVNLQNSIMELFEFYLEDEQELSLEYAELKTYLYEPNASIMKAGAFKSLAKNYQLGKLAANSHLYSSDSLLSIFPGRIFKIIKQLSSKELKGLQANVISRNHPLKPDEIQKKYKIKNGGDDFIIASSLKDGKKVFLKAKRLK